MGQLALFAAGETLLVDDERGRIVYTPAFIDADTARVWFDEIRARVRWRAERRIMYDREVGVPRLVPLLLISPFPLRLAYGRRDRWFRASLSGPSCPGPLPFDLGRSVKISSHQDSPSKSLSSVCLCSAI